MGKELYTAIMKNGSIDEYDFSGKEYPFFYKNHDLFRLALENNRMDIALKMLENGQDINFRAAENEYNYLEYFINAYYAANKQEAALFLLEHGANVYEYKKGISLSSFYDKAKEDFPYERVSCCIDSFIKISSSDLSCPERTRILLNELRPQDAIKYLAKLEKEHHCYLNLHCGANATIWNYLFSDEYSVEEFKAFLSAYPIKGLLADSIIYIRPNYHEKLLYGLELKKTYHDWDKNCDLKHQALLRFLGYSPMYTTNYACMDEALRNKDILTFCNRFNHISLQENVFGYNSVSYYETALRQGKGFFLEFCLKFKDYPYLGMLLGSFFDYENSELFDNLMHMFFERFTFEEFKEIINKNDKTLLKGLGELVYAYIAKNEYKVFLEEAIILLELGYIAPRKSALTLLYDTDYYNSNKEIEKRRHLLRLKSKNERVNHYINLNLGFFTFELSEAEKTLILSADNVKNEKFLEEEQKIITDFYKNFGDCVVLVQNILLEGNWSTMLALDDCYNLRLAPLYTDLFYERKKFLFLGKHKCYEHDIYKILEELYKSTRNTDYRKVSKLLAEKHEY